MFGQGTQGGSGGFGQMSGLFSGGQPPQQQQQPAGFGGFGQAAQQKPAFPQPGFGAASSGLFGQQAQSAQGFAGSTASAQGFGTGTGSSLFGASGGTGGFGQTQQPAQSSLFGGQQVAQPQSTFGVQQNTSAFGGQQPSQGTNLFGANPGSFGQTSTFGQTSAFGQQQQTQPTTGFFGQTAAQPQLGTGSTFGGGGSLFNQALQQPLQPAMGQGLFGQQPKPAAGPAFGGLGAIQQQPTPQKTGFYSDQAKCPASIVTIGQHFQPKLFEGEDKQDGRTVKQNLQLKSCRGQENFASVTHQMIRFADYQQMKGVQQPSYENLAFQEYNSNPAQYNKNLFQMFLNIESGKQTSTGANRQSWFGQQQKETQSPVFGTQNPQSAFGQPGFAQAQQQPQQTTQFGAFAAQPQQQQTWPMGAAGGAFGQQAQPAMGAQPQQTTGLFGKPQGTGLFGASTPQTGFGGQGTGLFGATTQQPQQQQANPGGLFAGTQTQPATGLLSGTQQQQATGLFGQTPQAQPAQAATGLFSQPQSAGTGLFAQKQGTAIGGAFAQPQQPAQLSNGLFSGLAPAKQSTPALFAGGSQPAAQTNSLFAQPQPGGLFSSQPQTNPIFGGQTQQPATGGLFAPKPAQQTSMFAGQNQQTASGGLFGLQAAPQTGLFQSGQGLFGQPTASQLAPGIFQQQQPGQQQMANLNAHFQNTDPFDMNSGFISKASPIENFQQELDKIRQQSAKQAEELFPQPQEQQREELTYVSRSANDIYNFQVLLELEKQKQLAKQEAKFRNMQYIQELSRQSSVASSSNYKDLRGSIVSDQPQLYAKNVTQSFQHQPAPKPDLSRRFNLNQTKKLAENTDSNDVLTLTVGFKFEGVDENNQIKGYPEYTITFGIYKEREIADVYTKVTQWMEKEFSYQPKNGPPLKLFFGGKEISNSSQSLSEAGIKADCKLEVVLEQENQSVEAPSKIEIVPQRVELKQKELAPQQQVPKAPKSGYRIEPEFIVISRMTLDELRSVEGLKLSNEFGSVEFLGKTDISQVDFDDVVTISQGSVEVYDEKRHKDIYPKVGEKLNRPAIITLQNIKPKKNQTGVEKELQLRNLIEKGGGEHISYDIDTCTWTFKVQHFTRWGEGDDEQSRDSSSNLNGKSDAEFHDEREIDQVMDDISDSVSMMSDRNIYETYRKPIKKKIIMSAEASDDEVSYTLKSRKLQDLHESQLVVVPQISDVQKQAQIKAHAKQAKEQEILNRIKARNEKFNKKGQRPSNSDTMALLLKIDGKLDNYQKTSLKQGGMPRPSFHPNGGIVFVSGNKIKVVNTVPQKEFSLLDVLMKHRILAKDESLHSQFSRMAFSTFQKQSQNIQDGFFREFFNAGIPSFLLFVKEPNKSMSLFLYDLAQSMARACKAGNEGQNKALRHEFYVVCAMNALFGNPIMLLHQFHEDYKGPKTIEKAASLHLNHDIETEEPRIVEKIRRNAIVELLKFICSLEFPVNTLPASILNDDQLYNTVKKLILNGEIKSAVNLLQAKKKTKLALILSQSVNATFNMQMLKSFKDNILAQGLLNENFSQIFDIITGQKPQAEWQQTLLCSLLFEQKGSDSFTEIVAFSEVVKSGPKCAFLTLLRVYAQIPCQDDLLGLSFQLTSASSGRDNRLAWLMYLVLMNVIYTDEKGKSTNRVEIKHFTDVATKFARQLLHQKDWRCAIAVALLIPQNHVSVRQALVFEILSRKAPLLQSQSEIEYLKSQMGLPEEWLYTSRAMYHQYSGMAEIAVREWIRAKNFDQAHSVLYRQILPLYMVRSSPVQVLKALTQMNLTQAEKKSLILGNEISLRQKEIDEQLIEFELKADMISGWQTQGGLYRRFTKLIDSLAHNTISTEIEVQKRNIIEIAAIRRIAASNALCKPTAALVVSHFISQQLLEVEAQLKIVLVQQASAQKFDLNGDFAIANLVRGNERSQLNKAATHRVLEETTEGFIYSMQKNI